ncbi:MAG: amino acid permease, partial [Planctomycetota bacterium]
MPDATTPPGELKRELGLWGAVLLGLGSILGTGAFVTVPMIGFAAGPAALPAVLIAGLLAGCNGLSSARLAGRHPVSGGTYEYGHLTLNAMTGFAAGAMFLAAKSASCATAALGLA